MTVTDLIHKLNRLGVRLEVSGNRLRFHPAEKVSDDLRREMIAQKTELLSLLRQQNQETFYRFLKGEDILAAQQLEFCLAGCGQLIEFNFSDGVGYGYCLRCNAPEMISNKIA